MSNELRELGHDMHRPHYVIFFPPKQRIKLIGFSFQKLRNGCREYHGFGIPSKKITIISINWMIHISLTHFRLIFLYSNMLDVLGQDFDLSISENCLHITLMRSKFLFYEKEKRVEQKRAMNFLIV